MRMRQETFKKSYYIPAFGKSIEIRRNQDIDEDGILGKELLAQYGEDCILEGETKSLMEKVASGDIGGGGVDLTPDGLTSTQAKDAIYKAHSMPSASEIDGLANIHKNTVVIDGDSIAAQNGYYSLLPDPRAEPSGFFTWANVLLNNKMKLLSNNGVGGNRTDHLLARLETSINLKPRFMIINIGKNDIVQAISINVIKANILEIYTRVTNAGIICVMNNIIPAAISTRTEIEDIFTINNYMRELQSTLDNLIVVDMFGAIANPSTALSRTNMLVLDNIHPSTQGAYYMGKALADAVDKYIPNINIFQGANLDLKNSLVTNGYMLGGETTATSWDIYINGTGVKSKVVRTNGLEWQEVDMTTLGNFHMSQSIYTNFTIGEKWKLVWEYEIDSAAVLDSFSINCTMRSASGIVNVAYALNLPPSTTIRFPSNATTGVIETPTFTIPTNTIRLIPYFLGKLTGKFRIGRCRFIKMN